LCLNTNRTPGYPAFVAAIYSLTGAQPWVVLAVQALVDALTIALTYTLGIRLFTPVAAAAGALLLALDPTTLFTSSSLLTDSLFTLLFLSAVSVFLLDMGSAQHRWAIAAGLALGLAAWVRPSAQYVPVLLFAAALCRGAWPWRHRLAFGATLVLAFMLTISPWLYRNQQQFGALALATVKSDTLLNWHAAFFIAWRDHKPVEEVRQDLENEVRASGWFGNGNPVESGVVKERVALRHMQAQPVAYARAMLRGMVFMYASAGTETIARKLRLGEPAATRVNLRNESTMRA
jgi:4-amino-4-deoxy-L-arabinose transferase-like glycosyltransferase